MMIQENRNILDITPRLRDRCKYNHFTGERGKVLFLTSGYFLQKECLRGFYQNGLSSIRISTAPESTFISRLFNTILSNKPDFVFTLNHLGFDQDGLLTRIFEDIEMPVVSWFVDSPEYILLNHHRNASKWVTVFTWERETIPFLNDFGFENCHYLPLAGDTAVFNKPWRKDNYKYELSFVGDSMNYGVKKWKTKLQSNPELLQLVDKTAQGIIRKGKKISQSSIEQEIMQGNVFANLSGWDKKVFKSTVVLKATQDCRYELMKLLSKQKLSIFGDKGWSENLPGDFLHANVDYYTELQEVYNNSRINLNQTSFQMPTAVNQRVFDVPLSGGFLITDEQEDMNTLFNTGNDCVTYDCVDEIPELVKYFQNNSPIREKITKRAAEHILRHHTYFRRLETMVTKLKKEYKHNFAVPAEVGLN